jgi:hypothetical protein
MDPVDSKIPSTSNVTAPEVIAGFLLRNGHSSHPALGIVQRTGSLLLVTSRI